MFDWIKKFFVKGQKEKIPKCYKCGLMASHIVFMEIKTIELEETNNNILVQLCNHCHLELFQLYDKEYLPPLIKEE